MGQRITRIRSLPRRLRRILRRELRVWVCRTLATPCTFARILRQHGERHLRMELIHDSQHPSCWRVRMTYRSLLINQPATTPYGREEWWAGAGASPEDLIRTLRQYTRRSRGL